MFIQQHSNSTFYLYFTDIQTDKRKKVSLKTSDIRKAKKLLKKYETLPHLIYSELVNTEKFLNKKYDGLALDKIKPNIVYLSSMVKRYIEHSEKNHTVKTHKAIQQTFKFFCAFIGNMDFTLLKKSSINDCIKLVENYPLEKIQDKQLTENYFSKRTEFSSIYQSRKDKINLSGFFTYLISYNLISVNPVSKVKLQKIPTKLPLYMDNTELEILINATSNIVLRDIFQIGYYTGMRLGEILTLKYNMLDFGSKTIKLDNQDNATITKSKKFRTIPMNQTVFNILTELRYNAKTDNVFLDLLPQNDKADFVTKQFKKIVRTTNLDKRLHFHCLRHSFATNLSKNGVAINVIQRLLGHQNITTTMVYTHIGDEQLTNAINVL